MLICGQTFGSMVLKDFHPKIPIYNVSTKGSVYEKEERKEGLCKQIESLQSNKFHFPQGHYSLYLTNKMYSAVI